MTPSRTFEPNEAKLILEHLIGSGMVKAADVQVARQALKAEVETLATRLANLRVLFDEVTETPARVSRSRSRRARSRRPRRSAATVTPTAATTEAAPVAKAPRSSRKRSRKALTPERRKIMQLQGRYLGLMHKVSKKDQVRFKNLIPTLGKEEVVRQMETIVKKGT